jgi:MoaA/NifB/PqqE/SkfB family radical SAM enzyme
MAVPVSQMWTVASYVLRQKLAGRTRYPLVLMLEPLFRCNLACAGCGKIQYPAHILKTDLSPTLSTFIHKYDDVFMLLLPL